MNTKRWLVAALAVFVVTFALNFLIHGVLLMDFYRQTAAIWRPQSEANQLRWLMVLGDLLLGLAFAWFYTKGYEAKSTGKKNSQKKP